MQGTGLLSRFPAAGQMPVMRPPPTGDRMSMQPPPSGDQMPIARPAPQFMPQLSSSGGPFGSMTQAQFYQFLKQNGMLSSTPSTDPWPAM
jgi:hypothetical protein